MRLLTILLFCLARPLYAVQYSAAVRDAKNDAVETAIGASPVIEFRSGAQPADCATAASGVLLATGVLPADWMAGSSGGVKAKSGVWTLTGVAAGTIGYYRIYAAGSPSLCHEQGSVTATGGAGDMTVDNTNIAVNQVVTVTSYQKTSGNA